MVSGAGRCETVHPRQVFVDREAHSSVYGDAPEFTALTAKCLTDFLNQSTGRLSGGSLSAVSGILVFCSECASICCQRVFNFYCDALNVPLPAAKKAAHRTIFCVGACTDRKSSFTVSQSTRTQGILLSANGGLRLGEVCALSVSDIDFQNGTFRIERAAQRIRQNGNTRLIVQTPKSESSVRIVPLPEDMIIFLESRFRSAGERLSADRAA